jgi:hypothetical protein
MILSKALRVKIPAITAPFYGHREIDRLHIFRLCVAYFGMKKAPCGADSSLMLI